MGFVMKAELAKIRRALARQDIVPELTRYFVYDRTIRAYDGRFVACCPCAYEGTFLVPSKEFELLLDRIPAEPSIRLNPEDNTLVIKSGRMRGQIRLLPHTDLAYPQPGPHWDRPPDNFLEALRLTRPFVSDNAIHQWALCISLEFNVMRATTNVSLVEVDCFDLDGAGQLLPCWAVDYLLSREEKLCGIQLTTEYAAFCWADGSWMRTQLIQGEFPAIARQLFEDFTLPTWRITDEWRAAYESISSLTESEVSIRADRIVGTHGVGTGEHFVLDVPLGENTETKFDPKFMDTVIKTATSINFAAYPNPVPFTAPGLRGVIVGRR